MEHPSKATLRITALQRRLALPAEDVARRSQLLSQNLFRHFPVASWQWLSIFLPLTRRHEPDTWPIIRRIWAEKLPVRLAVPVVQPDGISLRHYELLPHTPLVSSRWGIPEPDTAHATEAAPADFDAVLVPLLAVDHSGQRVGYGGGFYDRFLTQCRPGTQFIVLNVLDEAPISPLSDVLPSDVPLHACITPKEVCRF